MFAFCCNPVDLSDVWYHSIAAVLIMNGKLNTLWLVATIAPACRAIEVLWYKPHWQCGGTEGSTPTEAAAFVNSHLSPTSLTDFVGVCEWEVGYNTAWIGNPEVYGSIGSACGYGSTPYTSPTVLFYRLDKWVLEASYPPSPNCQGMVPIPSDAGSWIGPQVGPVCVDRVTPGENDCCSCTYSEHEYSTGTAIGQGLGQRAWAGGLFSMKKTDPEWHEVYEKALLLKQEQGGAEAEPKVCVVTGEVSSTVLPPS